MLATEEIVVLIFLFAHKKKFSIMLLNSFLGILTLVLLKVTKEFININIAVNIISVLYSLTLGPIGPFLFFLIDYIFL